MRNIHIGGSAPDFTLPTNGDSDLTLSSLKGNPVVLFFYPKDMTPGCTTESQNFRDLKSEFDKIGVTILGISRDSPARHDKFIAKHDLNFTLVSDEEGQACEAFGVWRLKKFMGREFMGIVRSSFLIDAAGNIAEIWDNVKVKGHAQAVLTRAQML